MSLFKNYDPQRVIVTFGEVLFIGIADGTFVTAERAEDAYSTQVGAGGDVTRVRSRNRVGSVTVTLQGASPINDIMSTIAASDEAFGLGYRPLMIKDLNGTTLATAAVAWIKKIPNVEYGADGGNRAWVIDCAELFMYVGGATL